MPLRNFYAPRRSCVTRVVLQLGIVEFLRVKILVLDGMVRVNENSAEHLHVDVAVEHLDQSVIRLAGVGFEEHQRDFPLWRKHRGIALRMLFRKCRCELFCHLLQGKHGMEATEFTRFKALAIFLHQIEFCERKNRADLDNFL